MAGGVGSRFWPKSRNHFPKQFIDILGTGESLLQLTYQRFLKVCPNENIMILTNAGYAELVKGQLPNVFVDNILLEPSRNNTAPCIAYGTYKILQKNPEANIVVAPSDHLILKEDVFIDKINQALDFATVNDALLTLGISPTRPDTGYGYIEYLEDEGARNKDQGLVTEIKKVAAFKEKPVLEKAQKYVESGNYLWNAGIFIWKAANLQQAFEKYATEIDTLFKSGNEVYNTPEEAQFILDKYPGSPDISIDYAILEKADNIYTIPADIGWSDLGTWASLHSIANKDLNGNVINSTKNILDETSNCLINVMGQKAVIIKGLKDYIVVEDDQVLLIYPKSEEQEIKNVSREIVRNYGISYS